MANGGRKSNSGINAWKIVNLLLSGYISLLTIAFGGLLGWVNKIELNVNDLRVRMAVRESDKFTREHGDTLRDKLSAKIDRNDKELRARLREFELRKRRE